MLAAPLVVIVHGINQYCCAETRRKPNARVCFPPGGCTWRGGGFDDKFRSFFKDRLRDEQKYRVRCWVLRYVSPPPPPSLAGKQQGSSDTARPWP